MALRQEHRAWLSQMFGRQIGVGKPLPANSTLSTVIFQMCPDVLPKSLDGNFARALLVNAIDLGGLIDMKVLLAMLDDRRGIPPDPGAASSTVAYKNRFDIDGDDFDKMGERRELLSELLHCIRRSQFSLERRSLATSVSIADNGRVNKWLSWICSNNKAHGRGLETGGSFSLETEESVELISQ